MVDEVHPFYKIFCKLNCSRNDSFVINVLVARDSQETNSREIKSPFCFPLAIFAILEPN